MAIAVSIRKRNRLRSGRKVSLKTKPTHVCTPNETEEKGTEFVEPAVKNWAVFTALAFAYTRR